MKPTPLRKSTIPLRRQGSNTRGSNVVEFAFILPFMLLFLSLAVDFGRYIQVKQMVINLTRQTADLASRSMDTFVEGGGFDNSLAAAIVNASPFTLTNKGRCFIGRINFVNDKFLVVQYGATGGMTTYPAKVLDGGLYSVVDNMPTNAANLKSNDVIIVECFYQFIPVMPFSKYFFPNQTNLETSGVYDYAYF